MSNIQFDPQKWWFWCTNFMPEAAWRDQKRPWDGHGIFLGDRSGYSMQSSSSSSSSSSSPLVRSHIMHIRHIPLYSHDSSIVSNQNNDHFVYFPWNAASFRRAPCPPRPCHASSADAAAAARRLRAQAAPVSPRRPRDGAVAPFLQGTSPAKFLVFHGIFMGFTYWTYLNMWIQYYWMAFNQPNRVVECDLTWFNYIPKSCDIVVI